MNSRMSIGPSFQSKNIRILIPGEKEFIHEITDAQGALIKKVSNAMVKDGAQVCPIDKKDSQIFSTLIEILTGKKLPTSSNEKAFMTNFYDDHISLVDDNVKVNVDFRA